jgi:hypothetical protein
MSFLRKGPFGEVRAGRVGVTAGSLQWKDCYFCIVVVVDLFLVS